jgi:predicted ATP-grasp superfamily ATP-dependent carboligase
MGSFGKIKSISILIPDGGNYDSLKVLYCLGQVPETKVHVLSRAKWPVARFSRYCSKFEYHTSQNDNTWIDVIKDVVHKWDIDVVLPVTPRGIELISRNHEVLSQIAAIPPVAKLEQIRIADGKWTFQQFLEQHGLPGVPTLYIGIPGEIAVNSIALDSFSYPALLKPVSQMGGYGIIKVKNSADCYRIWNDKNHTIKGEQYILQSFITGVDFSLSVCCHKGEIIAYSLYRVILPCKSHFGTGRLLEYVDDEKVIDIGRKILSVMAWDGVANIDFVVDGRDQSVRILEFNPRFWRTLLGSMFAGVNFPFIWCLSAVGIDLPCKQREGARYASPSQYLEILASRLAGKGSPIKVSLKESGLRLSVSDPLAELVNAYRGILGRLHGHNGDNN